MARHKTITSNIHEQILNYTQMKVSGKKIAKILGIAESAVSKYSKLPITEDLTPVEEHRLKRENSELRSSLNSALDKQLKDTAFRQFIDSTVERRIIVPEWTKPHGHSNRDLAIATAMLSDLHLDEVVRPEQIGYVNEFNRAIALKRLHNFFDNTARIAFDHMKGVKYEGLVLPLGGDIFSGTIHEELRTTNESTLIESLLYWPGPLVAGLRLLAKSFKKIYLPCVVGNHGRLSHKPIAKNRPQDNFDYLLYHLLQRELKSDKRIVFGISEGADLSYDCYSTRFLLTHGDQFRGGSGIAGMLSPLLLGSHRKSKRQVAVGKPYDWMIFGHWHQLTLGVRGLIGNGCFVEGTQVITEYGRPQDIEKIVIGDRVLSTDGSFQTVTNLFEKSSEEGLVGLKVRGLPEVINVTPNHMIWAIKGESTQSDLSPKYRPNIGHFDKPQWIPADFISPGDWISVPTPKGYSSPISNGLAWVYGLFLAEGCAIVNGGRDKKANCLDFTMHIDELHILEKAQKIIESEFGKTGILSSRPKKTTSTLRVNGRDLAIKFREMFGHKSVRKHLADFMMDMNDELKHAVIQGWVDGDGHTRNDGVTCATTISKNLAYGLFHMALSSGMMPSMAALEAGGPRLNKSYTIHFNSGQEQLLDNESGMVFYRVAHRFRNNKAVIVYDLEVEGEHTYTAGLAGVHNSLKGYDEYAMISNFDFEPPQQAFWLTQPRHGVTIRCPVHVIDKSEKYCVKN